MYPLSAKKCNVDVRITTEGNDLLVDVGDIKPTVVLWAALGHAVLNPFGMVPSVVVATKALKDIMYQCNVSVDIDIFMDSKK